MKAENLYDLLHWQPPKQEYIISHGILIPQTKLVLYGKWESWKSMLIMDLGFHIASGASWLGFDVIPSTVYMLQIEIPKAQFQKRISKYVWGNNLRPENIYFRNEFNMKLDKAPYLRDLELDMQASVPKVLIVDPIYKVVTGKLTEDDSVRRFQDEMDRLIDSCKVAVILVHHDRKTQLVDGQPYISEEDIFGSSLWSDWFDTQVRTTKTHVDGEVMLTFEKTRHAEEEIRPIKVGIDRHTLQFGDGNIRRHYMEIGYTVTTKTIKYKAMMDRNALQAARQDTVSNEVEIYYNRHKVCEVTIINPIAGITADITISNLPNMATIDLLDIIVKVARQVISGKTGGMIEVATYGLLRASAIL